MKAGKCAIHAILRLFFCIFSALVAHLQLPIGLFISNCNFNLPLFVVGSVNFFCTSWLKLVYGLRSYKNVAIAQNWVKIVRQPNGRRSLFVLLLLLLLLLPVADCSCSCSLNRLHSLAPPCPLVALSLLSVSSSMLKRNCFCVINTVFGLLQRVLPQSRNRSMEALHVLHTDH